VLEIEIETRIPLLEDIRIRNQPLPLWYGHWVEMSRLALKMRQHIARPIDEGGLDFLLSQYENTQRGLETLRGQIIWKQNPNKETGQESWLKLLCTKINLHTEGSKPIEKLQLTRLSRQHTYHLAYYGFFYCNQMEIIIYIGSGRDIDGADVTHLPRSRVDESTRDWKLLAGQLPLEIWIKEA